MEEVNRNYDPSYAEEISINVEINGEKKDCFIIAMPKSKHGSYIALLPKEKHYFESCKLLLFKFITPENEDPRIESIEDDAEYDYANDLLMEIIQDQHHYDLIKKYKDDYK